MRLGLGLAFAALLLTMGCESASEADAGPIPLPAEECAPACVPATPPPNVGDWGASTCYDGCNWCQCTTAGALICTGLICPDAGSADAGSTSGG